MMLVYFVIFLSVTSVHSLLNFHKLELKLRAKQMHMYSKSSDLWMDQKLDHFHAQDDRIWKQRYFAQMSFDQPNGPVFLQISGEGPASPVWMEQGHWITMAKQFGATCFMLEHRFYGKSRPTSDASDKNMMYLSSEQALADVAHFIEFATQKYHLNDRKWIVIGGSYSGALSVWARLKYPHLVAGAISASAPLNAEVSFSAYLDVVSNALSNYGSTSCVATLADAAYQVASNLATTEGREYLEKTFKVCEPLSAAELDDENFQQALAGNIMGVVQYNKDNRAFEGAVGGDITIETVCSIMDNSSLGNALERYAHFNQLILNVYEQQCLDASYSKFVMEMKNTSWSDSVGGRAWLYQTCTEFGWYQCSDSQAQPFVGFPLPFTLDQCKSVFGISATEVQANVDQSNVNYGALKVAQVVTNVTLYNGGVDPWHNVSFYGQPIGFAEKSFHTMFDSNLGIATVFVPDTAHCAIQYPASEHDSPGLVQARQFVESVVASWLGLR